MARKHVCSPLSTGSPDPFQKDEMREKHVASTREINGFEGSCEGACEP